ncbi:hypothetical protein [Lachnoclostridium phytofermentans]|uniref:Uncharacterized protein n=1 Tax=Lachnoclostridium phytofermentans (strain ATCC 700394 / DSM 18823 / ISDg) TaxID=357809 RepID=A9KIX5_LACP7|nr:hypothetical protein [Lachnoclostridium phytofermentans]ABX40974.1 hypothetical protein Cphy_0587 [Lachnoclostridium phytofermentans ISDg]
MKNQLLRQIERDLKLKRFINEAECDYNQRIIYSVGAAWVQTLLFGSSYKDIQRKDEYQSVDIMYVQSYLAKVLEAYLQCFDINLDWLDEDYEFDIVKKARILSSEIIQATLYNENLAEIQSRRLVPLVPRYIKYGEGLYLFKGDRDAERNLCAVGASLWKVDEVIKYEIEYRPINENAFEYYRSIVTKFPWRQKKITGEYLMFHLGNKTALLNSWKPVDIEKLPPGIHLLKLASEYNGGYLLVKKDEDVYSIVDLDPWYIENGEIYRIMYALNAWYKSPTVFKYDHKGEYIILKSHKPLPKSEKKMLMAASWPYRTYKDQYYRIVPEFLWEIITKRLNELGIILIKQGEST